MTETMDEVIPKRPGRPATGRDKSITIRLPRDLLLKIDALLRQYEGMGRSTAIRCLLELGLSAPRKKLAKIRDPKEPFGRFIPAKEYSRKAPPATVKAEVEVEVDEPAFPPPPRRQPRVANRDWIKAAADRAEARAKGKKA